MSAFPFPFDDLAALFDPAADCFEVTTVKLRGEEYDLLADNDVSPDEAFRLGLYDLLCDTMLRPMGDASTRYQVLHELLSTVSSLYAPLRFRFYEQNQGTQATSLAGSARDASLASLRQWVVPRLERDIAAYEARIVALNAALAHLNLDQGHV
ncbi:MAG: hypothetical protein ACYDCC_09725 [Actinomycetota bacterium]